MNLLSVILQSPAPGGGGLGQIMFLVLIIVVFYFFMIRPQTKKAKVEREFRDSLQKGAKVVTIGGIHGRIIEVNDKTFMIEIDTNVKVRVEKTAIAADATKALDSNKEAK
ncbi:MAG: preprotein translocase subunit YajC [Bacteroidetes bacterium]|nr:preprotein translocase subunit YajC [Bacteroidota bacterium]